MCTCLPAPLCAGLLFLDEPTSGLDAFTAFHICETLQRLARAGRTVLTTIHAPRSDIYHLFDRMMILAQGTPDGARRGRSRSGRGGAGPE